MMAHNKEAGSSRVAYSNVSILSVIRSSMILSRLKHGHRGRPADTDHTTSCNIHLSLWLQHRTRKPVSGDRVATKFNFVQLEEVLREQPEDKARGKRPAPQQDPGTVLRLRLLKSNEGSYEVLQRLNSAAARQATAAQALSANAAERVPGTVYAAAGSLLAYDTALKEAKATAEAEAAEDTRRSGEWHAC